MASRHSTATRSLTPWASESKLAAVSEGSRRRNLATPIGSANVPPHHRNSARAWLQAVLTYLARMPRAPLPLPYSLLSIEILASTVPHIPIASAQAAYLAAIEPVSASGGRPAVRIILWRNFA